MNFTKRSSCTAVLLVFAIPAHADSAIIEHCRQAESAEARIACLEEALMDRADRLAAETRAADSQAAVTTSGETGTADAPNTDGASPVLAEALELQTELSNGDDGLQTDQPLIAAELGAEQVRTPEQRAAALGSAAGLRVARYETVPYRRLEVHLANGQVWRQIKGDTQQLRASLRKNQTVDIEESSLGGYKLRLNEMRRTVRVRRVR